MRGRRFTFLDTIMNDPIDIIKKNLEEDRMLEECIYDLENYFKEGQDNKYSLSAIDHEATARERAKKRVYDLVKYEVTKAKEVQTKLIFDCIDGALSNFVKDKPNNGLHNNDGEEIRWQKNGIRLAWHIIHKPETYKDENNS